MTTATLQSRFDASGFNVSPVNRAPFNPLIVSWPTRARERKPKGLDKKRITAIAAVICAHLMVFGGMLLPLKPVAPALQMPSDLVQLVLEPEIKVAPPPPPPPVEIIREIKPRNANTTPVRESAPVISQPALAVTAAPAEELGAQVATPTPDLPAALPDLASESLALLHAPPPRYPVKELKQGIQGTVHFKVRVGIDGRVSGIEVIKSSGSRNLDRAAVEQIKRRWVFEPRLHDGKKVESTGIGQLSFLLQ